MFSSFDQWNEFTQETCLAKSWYSSTDAGGQHMVCKRFRWPELEKKHWYIPSQGKIQMFHTFFSWWVLFEAIFCWEFPCFASRQPCKVCWMTTTLCVVCWRWIPDCLRWELGAAVMSQTFFHGIFHHPPLFSEKGKFLTKNHPGKTYHITFFGLKT